MLVERPARGLKTSARDGLLMLRFSDNVQRVSSKPLERPPGWCPFSCSCSCSSRSCCSRLCGATTWNSSCTRTIMPLCLSFLCSLLTSSLSMFKASASRSWLKPLKTLPPLCSWPCCPCWRPCSWNSCCGLPPRKKFYKHEKLFPSK